MFDIFFPSPHQPGLLISQAFDIIDASMAISNCNDNDDDCDGDKDYNVDDDSEDEQVLSRGLY